MLMPPLLANIFVEAFLHSTGFNKIIVVGLVGLSLLTWTTILGKHADIKIINKRNRDFFKTLKKKSHPAEYYLEAGGAFAPGTPMAAVYVKAMTELFAIMHRKGHSDDVIATVHADGSGIPLSETEMASVRTLAEGELSEQIIFIETKMSTIGTCTTAAPSVGLLGTVWGVMEAFMSMASSGSAMITSVAPGISGALLTTVLGLIVAIPSAVGYNFLSDRIKATIVKTENFTDELLARIARTHAILNEDF